MKQLMLGKLKEKGPTNIYMFKDGIGHNNNIRALRTICFFYKNTFVISKFTIRSLCLGLLEVPPFTSSLIFHQL